MKNGAPKPGIRKSGDAIVHRNFVATTCNDLFESIDKGLLDPVVRAVPMWQRKIIHRFKSWHVMALDDGSLATMHSRQSNFLSTSRNMYYFREVTQ